MLLSPVRVRWSISQRCKTAEQSAHAGMMDAPVYEAPELMNISDLPQYNAALPLGPPTGPADTQALQLGTNGDILFGRADNGARLECFAIMCLAPAPCND